MKAHGGRKGPALFVDEEKGIGEHFGSGEITYFGNSDKLRTTKVSFYLARVIHSYIAEETVM